MSGIDIALTLNRIAVGLFFAISGYHKLTNADRHAALVATLKADKIPLLRLNQWFVPGVELVGGTALLLNVGTVFSALLLGAICLVATCTDGWKRIAEWHPVDKADVLDDVLYLPEVLYGIMLLTVILSAV